MFRRGPVHGGDLVPADDLLQRDHVLGALLPRLQLHRRAALGAVRPQLELRAGEVYSLKRRLSEGSQRYHNHG